MPSNYRNRKQWSTSTDIEIYEKFNKLAEDTRINKTRLLDEALEDLLVKYKYMDKADKKNP